MLFRFETSQIVFPMQILVDVLGTTRYILRVMTGIGVNFVFSDREKNVIVKKCM